MARRGISVGGVEYRTKVALKRLAQEVVRALDGMGEQDDPFLASLINEHNLAVRMLGQRATGMVRIVRLPGVSGLHVQAFLEPLNDWRPVSVYGWEKENPRVVMKHKLREKLYSYIPRPSPSDRCAIEGCPIGWGGLEYDHVDPTFDQIAEECLRFMDDREIVTRLGFDYSTTEPTEFFTIPDDHPAVLRLIELHRDNLWRWLCGPHHRGIRRAP